jgi:hypothetical protein
MCRRVVLVRIDVSEEHIASIIRVKRISELGTLAVPLEASVFIRSTRRRIPEDGILHQLILLHLYDVISLQNIPF